MALKRAFIVGCGHPWRGDDAVGREVAMALWRQRSRWPALDSTTITWAHQLLPEMAFDISVSRMAVFVDASCGDLGAGSVRREVLPPPLAPRPGNVSVGVGCWEELTPRRLLALSLDFYGNAPPGVLVTVGVASLAPATSLSPAVREAVPRAVAAVLSALGPVACARAQRRPESTLGAGGPCRA